MQQSQESARVTKGFNSILIAMLILLFKQMNETRPQLCSVMNILWLFQKATNKILQVVKYYLAKHCCQNDCEFHYLNCSNKWWLAERILEKFMSTCQRPQIYQKWGKYTKMIKNYLMLPKAVLLGGNTALTNCMYWALIIIHFISNYKNGIKPTN